MSDGLDGGFDAYQAVIFEIVEDREENKNSILTRAHSKKDC